MKRPEFDDFRKLFLGCLRQDFKVDLDAWGQKQWLDLGDAEFRQAVLESLKEKLMKKYGVEFEINQRLLNVEGPVESAVIQTFHELSTINIMQRINAKITARRKSEVN